MSSDLIFTPPRPTGSIFQLFAIAILTAAGVFGLQQATQSEIGPTFLLDLLPGLVAVILAPVLAYRWYALQRAFYVVSRDGVRLSWGLRAEDIPMDRITSVKPAQGWEGPLPLPRLRWPGAVLGQRSLPQGRQVEFFASTTASLVLIETPERVFAISPANAEGFLQSYQRCMELGSLSQFSARSVYPTFLLARIWASVPARWLLISGFVFSLALLALVSLAIASRPQVVLGFDPDGLPYPVVPSVRLLLLPVLNSVFYLIDVLLGMFFFRREQGQPLAYLLWGSGVVTALLFIAGAYFLMSAG